MRVNRTNAISFILALIAGLWGAVCPEVRAAEPIPIQLLLDRPIDAAASAFVMAQEGGLFANEGFSVNISAAASSPDAIAKVAAGASEFALVDINALVRYRDKDKQGGAHIKAVFMLFNTAPYAIIARKSRGIQQLSDLAGKTLGVAEGDLTVRLWPAVAKQNGVKLASIKQNSISAAVREPILSAGQVDAVTGFSYLSAVNLKDRGIPADDLVVLKFADFGCEAYGFAIIVNPAFAAAKPEAVKGFVRATLGGLHLSIKDPTLTIQQVISRMEGGSRELEAQRLRMILRDNILTPEVRRIGLGSIDPVRFDKSIDQIAEDFKFQKRPTAADIFDNSFLPPLNGRLIN